MVLTAIEKAEKAEVEALATLVLRTNHARTSLPPPEGQGEQAVLLSE